MPVRDNESVTLATGTRLTGHARLSPQSKFSRFSKTGSAMQVTSVLFVSEATVLVAGASGCTLFGCGSLCLTGTSTGDVLVWDMARYWSAAYWVGPESATDPRLPTRRVNVFSGLVSRLVLAGESVLVAGRDRLVQLDLATLQSQPLLLVTPEQRCFNALSWDAALQAALVGAEDGSIVAVRLGAREGEENSFSFFEPVEGLGSAVLDLAVSASFVFAALANGCVLAIDRDACSVAWRFNLRRGEVESGSAEQPPSSAQSPGAFRATVVRVDPSGKWLLCGAGGNAASREGGFLSVWHAETREAVSVLPMRSCPSGACWLRGAVVCCGAENALYQYDLRGQLQAWSLTEALTECWDVAVFAHPDDIVGAAIAVGGAGGEVLVFTAVGRKPMRFQTS